MKKKKNKAGSSPEISTTGHLPPKSRYPLRSSSLSTDNQDAVLSHQITENPNPNTTATDLPDIQPVSPGVSMSKPYVPFDLSKVDVVLPREVLKYPTRYNDQNPNCQIPTSPNSKPVEGAVAEVEPNSGESVHLDINDDSQSLDSTASRPESVLDGAVQKESSSKQGVQSESVDHILDGTDIVQSESENNLRSGSADASLPNVVPEMNEKANKDGNQPSDEEVLKMTDKQFDNYLRSRYPNLSQPIVVDSNQEVHVSKDSTDPTEIPLHGEPNSPTKIQEPMSFAELFKEAENIRKKGTLRFIPPVVTDSGLKRPVIPRDLLLKQAENWSYTLIGHFIGKRPAFPFVNFHANRLWKKYGLLDVLLNDQGCFYFKFKSDQGLQFVFENGPWLFNDIPILLKKWHPDFWFEKPKPTEVSLWVNIYDLPVTLWDYEIMSHIVSAIGVPIAVDRYTAEMCEKKTGRAVFARVLVEVSASQDIPMFIEADILGTIRKFRLRYNWIPTRCSHCKIFGHTFGECTVRDKTAEEMEAIIGKVTEPQGEGTSRTLPDGFEQPKRRKRRSKRTQTTKGIVIGQSKPKVHYVPKKNQLPDDAKGKKVASDTVSTQVNIDAVDSSIPTGNQTSSVPSHAPNYSPNIETRNKFEGLDGVVSSGTSSSKKKKIKKKDAEADPWDKANLYKRFKAVYGDGVPNPYAPYVEVDQLNDSDDVENDT